jgi:hypothetical protein
MLWLGQNLISISVYIRDAIPMNLSLLGGDYVTHDWNYILGELGLLPQSILIADMVTILGYTTMVVGTVIVINSFISRRSPV